MNSLPTGSIIDKSQFIQTQTIQNNKSLDKPNSQQILQQCAMRLYTKFFQVKTDKNLKTNDIQQLMEECETIINQTDFQALSQSFSQKQSTILQQTSIQKDNSTREIQCLENELSYQKAKFLQLQNQVKEERHNIEQATHLLQFQKRGMIDKATQQQQAIINRLSKELTDKNDVLNLFMRKNNEKEKHIQYLNKQLNDSNAQIEKLKKKMSKYQKQSKTRKNMHLPRPLSAIGAQHEVAEQQDELSSDWDDNTEVQLNIQGEMNQSQEQNMAKVRPASELDIGPPQLRINVQQSTDEVQEITYYELIVKTSIPKEELVNNLQKLIKMPHYFAIIGIEQNNDQYIVKFSNKLILFHIFRLLKEQDLDVEINQNQQNEKNLNLHYIKIKDCKQIKQIETLYQEIYRIVSIQQMKNDEILLITDNLSKNEVIKDLQDYQVVFSKIE